jgi:hypothetical protein
VHVNTLTGLNQTQLLPPVGKVWLSVKTFADHHPDGKPSFTVQAPPKKHNNYLNR